MQTLAVVPIFVSAGAAVMPTVVAAVASVGAILLKPREMVRVVRQRPVTAVVSVLVVTGVIWGVMFLMGGHAAAKERRAVDMGASRVDWANVAKDILAREQAMKPAAATGVVTGGAGVNTTAGAGNGAVTVPVVEKSGEVMIEGRNAARNSWDGAATPTLSAGTGLTQLWAYRPDGGAFLSGPLVAGDKVYVAASQQDLSGYTGLLACLDRETGKPLWQTDSIGDNPLPAFFSSPALTADGKNLIVGQGLHTDADCSLLCFDTATGKLKWSVKTPLHLESSPAIFGDIAVVGAGAIEGRDGKAMGDPGYVLGVSISTGKELWRQAVNDPESSPAVDDKGVVYIGSGFNGEAVVAMESGEVAAGKSRVLWKTPTGLPIISAITVVGDMVVTGGGNGDAVHSVANARGVVVALDRKTGVVKWKTDFADAVLGPIALHDDMLICPCRTGEVAALSVKDGSVLWHTAVSGKSPVLAGCTVTGDRVFAVSSDGILGVMDLKGNMLEKMNLNVKAGSGLSLSPPLVAGDRIYVGSETGGFRCVVRKAQ